MACVGTLEVDAVISRDAFSVRACFEAAEGEVVGLAGDIGSGKSTVLAAIAGLLPVSEGSVRFEDEAWDDPATGARKPAVERAVGYLPQRPSYPDEVTGPELLGDDGLRRIEDIGLRPDVVERAAWTWSGGETQRIALLAALQDDPALLLLDDPFAALDRRTGTLVREQLAGWLASRSGPTVLVTSDPADLARFASRVVTLR